MNKNTLHHLRPTMLREGRELQHTQSTFVTAGVLMGMYEQANRAEQQALASACYNAGTGATAQALAYGSSWLTHLPLETQRYISAIVSLKISGQDVTSFLAGGRKIP